MVVWYSALILSVAGFSYAATELRKLEGSPFCDVEFEVDCDTSFGCAWNNNVCAIDPFNCDLDSEFYCENPDNHCVWVDGSCEYNDVVGEMEISNTVVDGEVLISGVSAEDISFIKRGQLQELFKSTFGAYELLLTLSPSECGLAPLCGSQGEMLPLPTGYQNFVEASPSMLMPCCAKRDTVPESDCQRKPNPGESTCRTHGILTPFCDPADVSANCDLLVEHEAQLTLRVATVVPARSNCCLTCTCYGDPHCISFSGEHDTWNICDARSTINCNYLKSKCPTLNDPSMNKCVWNSDPSHNVMRDGSRCTPNPASPAAWMDMYSADDFSLKLHAGERGSLKGANVTLSSGHWYYLSAVDCFEHSETPWEMSVGATIPETWQHIPSALDHAWIIGDDVTGIEARIRCVRNEKNGVYGGLRLNVEQVMEPNRDYMEDRTNLSGVCHADAILDKTGDTWTTDTILASGKCVNLREDVEIARIVCDNPSLHRDTVHTCAAEFCGKYHFPNYPSAQACEDEVLADWASGFCKAHEFDPDLVTECKSNIEEYSWEYVVSSYKFLEEVQEVSCVTTLDELPLDLEDCTPGLRIQYKAEGGEWVTVRAIPASKQVCRSGLVIDSSHTELFTRPVRVSQCSLPGRCITGNQCTPQSGFQANFEFHRLNGQEFEFTLPPTMSPVQEPTISPTVAPTQEPTTSPTAAPSAHPTLEPSKSPLREGQTAWPSQSPTKWPTSSPTRWPTSSPTKWPTSSPTKWPTSSPTKYPTNSPTLSPSLAPSNHPTTSPTDAPSTSPSTNPTGSPTSSPTDSPTTSPSNGPTLSPTKAPTVSPTSTESFVQTETPTQTPTPWYVRRLDDESMEEENIKKRPEATFSRRELDEETTQVKASFTAVFQDENIANAFLTAYNTFPSVVIESLEQTLNDTWVDESHPGVNIDRYQAGYSPSAGTLRFLDQYFEGIHDGDDVVEGLCLAVADVLGLNCGVSISVLSIYEDPEDGNITVLLEFNALDPLEIIQSLKTQDTLRKIQTKLKQSDDPILNSLTLTASGRGIKGGEATGGGKAPADSTATIIGVSIGVLVAVALVVGLFVRGRRNNDSFEEQPLEEGEMRMTAAGL